MVGIDYKLSLTFFMIRRYKTGKCAQLTFWIGVRVLCTRCA